MDFVNDIIKNTFLTACIVKRQYLVRLRNKRRFEWHRQNSSYTVLTKTNKVSFSSLEYRLCMVNFWASNVCFQRIHRACQGGATDLPKSLNRHVSKHGPDTDTLPCSEMQHFSSSFQRDEACGLKWCVQGQRPSEPWCRFWSASGGGCFFVTAAPYSLMTSTKEARWTTGNG